MLKKNASRRLGELIPQLQYRISRLRLPKYCKKIVQYRKIQCPSAWKMLVHYMYLCTKKWSPTGGDRVRKVAAWKELTVLSSIKSLGFEGSAFFLELKYFRSYRVQWLVKSGRTTLSPYLNG